MTFPKEPDVQRLKNAAEYLAFQFCGDGETSHTPSLDLTEYAAKNVWQILKGETKFVEEALRKVR